MMCAKNSRIGTESLSGLRALCLPMEPDLFCMPLGTRLAKARAQFASMGVDAVEYMDYV